LFTCGFRVDFQHFLNQLFGFLAIHSHEVISG
jgi:hypothetical protein